MSTRPRSAAAAPQTRRDQLAAIAAGLFAQQGYHNVSVNDIAAAAGLSGPAVYRHFRSKQAILGYVMRAGMDDVVHVVGDADALDADQRLHRTYAGLAAFVVRQPEFGVLWRRERRHLAPDDAGVMMQQVTDTSHVVVPELRRLRPGLSPADAEFLTFAAFSVLGSISDHRTRLPQAAFEALLTAIVRDVLAAALPSLPAPGSGERLASEAFIPDSRREQLLASAARLFWDRGYHAVTIEDIGSAAGIAGPSVYAHFAGKSDLLRTAATRVTERLRQAMAEVFGAGLAERESLDLLIASYIDIVLANRDLVAAYFSEGHNLPERDGVEARRFQRAYAKSWADLVSVVLPDRTEKEIRVRVHAAFAVVTDLAQTRRFSPGPGLAGQLSALMRTVLELPA